MNNLNLVYAVTQKDHWSFSDLKNKIGNLYGHLVIEIRKISSKAIKNKGVIGQAAVVTALVSLIFWGIKRFYAQKKDSVGNNVVKKESKEKTTSKEIVENNVIKESVDKDKEKESADSNAVADQDFNHNSFSQNIFTPKETNSNPDHSKVIKNALQVQVEEILANSEVFSTEEANEFFHEALTGNWLTLEHIPAFINLTQLNFALLNSTFSISNALIETILKQCTQIQAIKISPNDKNDLPHFDFLFEFQDSKKINDGFITNQFQMLCFLLDQPDKIKELIDVQHIFEDIFAYLDKERAVALFLILQKGKHTQLSSLIHLLQDNFKDAFSSEYINASKNFPVILNQMTTEEIMPYFHKVFVLDGANINSSPFEMSSKDKKNLFLSYLSNDQIMNIILNYLEKKGTDFQKIFLDVFKHHISPQEFCSDLGKEFNSHQVILLLSKLTHCEKENKKEFLLAFMQGILEGDKLKIGVAFTKFLYEKADIIESCLPHLLKNIDSQDKFEEVCSAVDPIYDDDKIDEESLEKFLSILIHGTLGISPSEKWDILNDLKDSLTGKKYDLLMKVGVGTVLQEPFKIKESLKIEN